MFLQLCSSVDAVELYYTMIITTQHIIDKIYPTQKCINTGN